MPSAAAVSTYQGHLSVIVSSDFIYEVQLKQPGSNFDFGPFKWV